MTIQDELITEVDVDSAEVIGSDSLNAEVDERRFKHGLEVIRIFTAYGGSEDCRYRIYEGDLQFVTVDSEGTLIVSLLDGYSSTICSLRIKVFKQKDMGLDRKAEIDKRVEKIHTLLMELVEKDKNLPVSLKIKYTCKSYFILNWGEFKFYYPDWVPVSEHTFNQALKLARRQFADQYAKLQRKQQNRKHQ